MFFFLRCVLFSPENKIKFHDLCQCQWMNGYNIVQSMQSHPLPLMDLFPFFPYGWLMAHVDLIIKNDFISMEYRSKRKQLPTTVYPISVAKLTSKCQNENVQKKKQKDFLCLKLKNPANCRMMNERMQKSLKRSVGERDSLFIIGFKRSNAKFVFLVKFDNILPFDEEGKSLLVKYNG